MYGIFNLDLWDIFVWKNGTFLKTTIKYMTGYFSYTQVKRVANNSEDGRKKILFSHAQVERFRENYICSCSSPSFWCFVIKKVYQQTVRRVPEKYMHLHILYAYQYLEWSVSHVIKGGTSKSYFLIKTKFMYSAVEILRTHLSTSSFKHFKHIPSTHTVLCACSFLMPTFLKGLMNHCAN